MQIRGIWSFAKFGISQSVNSMNYISSVDSVTCSMTKYRRSTLLIVVSLTPN